MRMLFLIIFSCVFLAGGTLLAESADVGEGPTRIFYSPGLHLEVTVSTEKGVATVLDIPAGVFLSISSPSTIEGDFEQNHELPQTIRGGVSLHIGREDEVSEGKTIIGEAIMARSPLTMTVENAVVVVAKAE
jgi:hypothetical protein